MKTALLVLIAVFSQAVAFADAQPEQINWPLKQAFIPIGFDNANNVQVVVAGVFPSTCYNVGPTTVNKPSETVSGDLEIQLTAYKSPGTCLQVQNPFFKVVDVGLMPKGDFGVRDVTSGVSLGSLPVAQAMVKAGPDDYPYAPVRDAIVGRNKDGSTTLMLVGVYTDKCMKMRGTPMIHYYSDVITVQPIIELDRSGGQCGPAKIPFQEFYNLKSGLPSAFLLHVRSMDGQAVNKIVDLQ